MIEVQCEFILKMEEVENKAFDLFQRGTSMIFPELKWTGRVQQKLVGQTQQSIFSLTTVWEDLAEWDIEYQKAFGNKKFIKWYSEILNMSLYGGDWKIAQLIEPYSPAMNDPRIIEIKSSYIVQFKNIDRATKVMHNGLIQNILKGHCSQRIFGPDAQTLFTWSSFWDSLSAWEKAIYNKPPKESVKSEAWFAKLTNVIDFGGPKEVFRNL